MLTDSDREIDSHKQSLYLSHTALYHKVLCVTYNNMHCCPPQMTRAAPTVEAWAIGSQSALSWKPYSKSKLEALAKRTISPTQLLTGSHHELTVYFSNHYFVLSCTSSCGISIVKSYQEMLSLIYDSCQLKGSYARFP